MKKHTHIPDKEKRQRFKDINVSSLKNNYVLCKRVSDNMNTPINGIIYPKQMNENQLLAQNTDRIYEVVALPDKLEIEYPFWETDIEIVIGDLVWVNYIYALNSPEIIDDDGTEYRLIKYFHLIVAKRKKAILPLNGNVLFSNIKVMRLSSDHLTLIKKDEIVYELGRVEYVGNPVKRYLGSDHDDEGIDVKCGEVVVLDTVNKNTSAMQRKYIESELFSTLGKHLFYEQRFRIHGVLN